MTCGSCGPVAFQFYTILWRVRQSYRIFRNRKREAERFLLAPYPLRQSIPLRSCHQRSPSVTGVTGGIKGSSSSDRYPTLPIPNPLAKYTRRRHDRSSTSYRAQVHGGGVLGPRRIDEIRRERRRKAAAVRICFTSGSRRTTAARRGWTRTRRPHLRLIFDWGSASTRGSVVEP